MNEENDIIVVSSTEALEALSRSEHDTKVATAKRYPRSIRTFQTQAHELATMTEEVAASCFYVLPRAGKNIEGPSVRMAEILATCYGNMSYGARIVFCDSKWITAQGVCLDFEKNVSSSIEVRRRITNKSGVTFNEDMIQTTGRAACAIALREAIFKVIPRAFWNDIFEAAKQTSIGKGKTMQQMRDDCIAAWKKAGASEKQVLEFLGRKGVVDIDTDDLILLRGAWTAMREENIGVDRILSREETDKKKVSVSDLIGKEEKQS